jgi:hypothetical protein
MVVTQLRYEVLRAADKCCGHVRYRGNGDKRRSRRGRRDGAGGREGINASRRQAHAGSSRSKEKRRCATQVQPFGKSDEEGKGASGAGRRG